MQDPKLTYFVNATGVVKPDSTRNYPSAYRNAIFFIYPDKVEVVSEEGNTIIPNDAIQTDSQVQQLVNTTDVFVFCTAGIVFTEESLDKLIGWLNKTDNPTIGTVYPDVYIKQLNTILHSHPFDKANTRLVPPVLLVRKEVAQGKLSFIPDINFFASLSDTFPVVHVPEPLVEMQI